MQTVGDLITAVEQRLLGSFRSEKNRLANDASSSTTTLTFIHDLQGITRNSYVGLGEELVYVWRVDRSARTAEVERGVQGTVATAHAAGDTADVNPRFPRQLVRQVLEEEIGSWPDGLFRVDTIETDVSGPERTFDLTGAGEFSWILQVQYERQGRPGEWQRAARYRLFRDLPTDQFPSGAGIRLFGNPNSTVKLRVTLAKPFDLSGLEAQTLLGEGGIGLTRNMNDIAIVGACWRLASTREMLRTFIESQGDSRRADEVPPGTSVQVARSFERIRDQRINEEAARLRGLYPWRADR